MPVSAGPQLQECGFSPLLVEHQLTRKGRSEYTSNKKCLLFCLLLKSHILGVPKADRFRDMGFGLHPWWHWPVFKNVALLPSAHFILGQSKLSSTKWINTAGMQTFPFSQHPFSLTPHFWLTLYFLAAVNKIPTTAVLSVVAQLLK